jgi:Domain of unknown function (DUF4338)
MTLLRYRGREIRPEDILYIRALIEGQPADSRRKLSTRLCEAWGWRQSNGVLRDMVCRGLLLMLERAGEIRLPAVAYRRHNPLAQRSRPEPVTVDQSPIEAKLRDIRPIEVGQVRRSGDEPLFNSLVEEHHYLGYEQPVGEHLKYLVWAQGRPMARAAGMTPEERLHFHQRESKPIMDRSWTSCTAGWRHSLPNGEWSQTRVWGRRSPICCGTGSL